MDINADTDKTPVEAAEAESAAQAPAEPERSRSGWGALVIFAVLATVVAWIAMVYNEYVSFYASVTGFVASVAGAILVGKGTWRSLAITSAIAAGVLAIVFGLLWGALRILVGS